MDSGTSVHLKLLGVGLVLLLVTSPVSSNCVKMKEVHLNPIAPSLTIKAVEFPDEDVLPIGSNVTISCVSNFSKEDFGLHYYGQPYWIQVYHNDNYVKDCGGGDGDAEDSMVCTFFIRNATKEDSGTYDCWSHNQITCTEGGINLDFREPSPPRFTVSPPQQTYVSAGSKTNMSCVASGVPLPVLTWYKDGLPVSAERATGVKRVSVLTFESVTSSHQGDYWCNATNSAGWNVSSRTILTLTQKPAILFHPKNVSAYLEGNFTMVSFLCKVNGNPTPVIGWLKDNSTKANGTVIQIGGISSLILALAAKEKASTKYSCVAKNAVGKAYSEEGTLEILAHRLRPAVANEAISDEAFFIGHPRGITASPGDHVVFTCAAEGSPVPEITWLKDGRTNVYGNATNVQGKYSTTSVLTIYSVEDRHGGEYACQVPSPTGNIISKEALLSITGDVSKSNGVSKFLWVSVAIAAILLVVVVILIFLMHNNFRKADFDVNKELNGGQQFVNLRIHEDNMGQQFTNKKTCAASHFQMTNMAVENAGYMQNVY